MQYQLQLMEKARLFRQQHYVNTPLFLNSGKGAILHLPLFDLQFITHY